MSSHNRSVMQIVEDQVRKWQFSTMVPEPATPAISVVTISREPGSGGKLIAQGIAEKLNLDLFHQEFLHEMARSANINTKLLESLDERGLNMLEDWVASVINRHHLWPDEYLKHLLKVIGTIEKHGHAVVVGRGANFILSPSTTFRLRVIAPEDFRANKVAQEYGLAVEDARRRIVKTESDRKAFVRKFFFQDVADPLNYDLVLNTGTVSIEKAVDAVCAIIAP